MTCSLDLHELTVPVDGMFVRAVMLGNGPPLILVHGLGTSSKCWDHNLEDLSAHARLYAVDLPGFGDSDNPDHVLKPEALADVLMRWCLAMDIHHASFVGHSLGGEVCIWLAAKYPTMVERLVLAASTGLPPKMSLPRRAGRLLLDGMREPFAFMPTLIKAYWKAGAWRIFKTIQASSLPEVKRVLSDITAPTLVAWGRHDPVISLDDARQMAALIPKGRLAVIEDGAHGLIFGAPQSFNQLVVHFLGMSEAALSQTEHGTLRQP